MTNYEKIKELCHQNFIGSEKCVECEGTGEEKNLDKRELEQVYNSPLIIKPDCYTCKGKGYTIPLEHGCEIEFDEPVIITANTKSKEKTERYIFPIVDPNVSDWMAYIPYKGELDNNSFDLYSHGFEKLEGYKVLGKPLTLYQLSKLVRDKHYLIDNWRGEYLKDQSEELLEWILSNH